METKPLFMHEGLIAYRVAIEFARMVKTIRGGLPRGCGSLGDQLSRAAQSVVLNLAEGAASRFRDVRRRHWDIAIASAAECGAALDLVEIECGTKGDAVKLAREHLHRTTRLTLGLIRR